MGLFKKKGRSFLFTKKLYLTTLPYLDAFEDGYLVTVFDPTADVKLMMKNFTFKLWAYTKAQLLVDYALSTKALGNAPGRFMRFAIGDDGKAIFSSPLPVDKLTDTEYKAANQVLKERKSDCIKAGLGELDLHNLPSDWIRFSDGSPHFDK